VNENLNDGDNGLINPTTEPAKDKTGEALMAGTLNINTGSVFDVNGLNVRLGPATLDIAGDAWLDLNTGLTLSLNDPVTTFVGVGDQSSTWAGFSDRVRDSSNPGYAFEPTVLGGDTYWAVTAIPEPGLAGLLALGGFLLVLRRRR
jgi:hypothetical protein